MKSASALIRDRQAVSFVQSDSTRFPFVRLVEKRIFYFGYYIFYDIKVIDGGEHGTP